MNSRSLRTLGSLLLIIVIAVLAWQRQHPGPRVLPFTTSQKLAGGIDENHYSPAENLEQLDIERIGQAQHSIDVAMYAFTDKYIAESLAGAASRGVKIRIYRDQQQYQDEQRNSDKHDSQSSSAMLSGQRNVEIRVKSKHELMHLKAYLIDGSLLRDGSANWSPSGLKRQDNNAHFTTDKGQIRVFQQAFEDMWSRNNLVLQ
jgi:phosphatidylserine/phosphatidylglycerophosphate/cardiolipin synthase-like enzyme